MLDMLCQQGGLVYGRPTVENRLLLLERLVDDWFDTSADESFGILNETHSRDTGR